MRRHGHHTRAEIDVRNPRWSETPDYVLEVIRGYLDGMDHGMPDPVEAHAKRTGEAERVAASCRRELGPLKRAIFGFTLGRARMGSVVRENVKSEAIRWIDAIRRNVLELGERLAARGVIGERDDIFFLSLDEVGPVSAGMVEFDVRRTISERRSEFERNLTLDPPPVVVGDWDPARSPRLPERKPARVFEGLSVSAGYARGRARVILRGDEGHQVLPGEILVAPFTDPGWTPYFLPAAGIVMDMGGMLSHGSIVAREYGIPAVVNVGPATELIRTGQLIEVDADHGVVRVLDDG
jgi:pyruvate,water dikinase